MDEHFGLGKVGYRPVGEAEVDLAGSVPGQVLMRTDWNARSLTPFWPGVLTRVRT